jgi:hypothetical protein
MAKRIWFTQQAPMNYIPLRMGLGYILAAEVYNFNGNGLTLCPKLYTTRTHPLSGEYIVVEGSRFKAKPVEPEIKFKADFVASFTINDVIQYGISWLEMALYAFRIRFGNINRSFPEFDLGFRGATFENLRDELLKLNKKATIDTSFYVNRLEAI